MREDSWVYICKFWEVHLIVRPYCEWRVCSINSYCWLQSTPIVAYCCSCCLFVCMFMFMVWGDVTKLKKNRVANWLMCGNFVTHFKKCKQHSVVWRVFWKEQRTKCKACAWFLVRLSLVMLLMTRKHPVRLCLVQALQPGILSLQVCTPWVRKSGQIIFWHFVLCHEPMIEIYAAVPGSTQQVKKIIKAKNFCARS